MSFGKHVIGRYFLYQFHSWSHISYVSSVDITSNYRYTVVSEFNTCQRSLAAVCGSSRDQSGAAPLDTWYCTRHTAGCLWRRPSSGTRSRTWSCSRYTPSSCSPPCVWSECRRTDRPAAQGPSPSCSLATNTTATIYEIAFCIHLIYLNLQSTVHLSYLEVLVWPRSSTVTLACRC